VSLPTSDHASLVNSNPVAMTLLWFDLPTMPSLVFGVVRTANGIKMNNAQAFVPAS